jgi:hypothetical protein
MSSAGRTLRQIRESGRFSSFPQHQPILGDSVRKALTLFCEQINIAVEQLWSEIQGINTSRCQPACSFRGTRPFAIVHAVPKFIQDRLNTLVVGLWQRRAKLSSAVSREGRDRNNVF